MILPWQLPLWLGTVLVLTLGTCVVVGLAAVCVSLTRSVAWQRAFWQVSILGILTLLAAEATGTSAGIVQWWRIHGLAGRGSRDSAPEAGPVVGGSGEVDGPATSASAPSLVLVPDSPDLATDGLPGGAPPELTVGEFPASVVDATKRPQAGWSPPVSGSGGLGRRAPIASAASTTAASLTAPSDGPWGVYLGLVWGCGASLLLARVLATRARLWRFRRRQRRLDQIGLKQRVEQLAARQGLRRRVDILTSSQLATPIAFGFVRPVIVLPTCFLDEFNPHQQDAMLAHELAHLAAGDPVWQLLADVAAALLWWHPLVWWLRGQWRIAGELAADEASLLLPQGAETLATCLVVLARRLESGPRLGWLSMAGPSWHSGLGWRVERLLGLSARTWRPPRRGQISVVTATILVALLSAAISCTAWARAWAPVEEGATTMKVFVDCWRQSLAAVTLVALLGPVSGDTPQALAAEGDRDVPRVNREGGDRPAAKPEREGERREGRREAAERKPNATEERKPETRGERERGREGGEPRETQAREVARRRAHLQEQAAEIRRKLEALKPEQEADRRELRGAMERIEVQLRELQSPAPDRERVQARLEELKAAVRRAQEEGRADEAERLTREARELRQTLRPRAGDRPAGRPEGEEVQRRLEHLRMAIENLRAAGLQDQANALARDAERLARGERPAAVERARRPDGPRDRPAEAPQLERAVQELRGQVQEIRQQMEEMRQHLKALAEKR